MDAPTVIPDFVALEVGILHLRLVQAERALAQAQAENRELRALVEATTDPPA